ncbi:MAG: DUF58 domain-containing protein [Candidatus Competibacterales bacterium]|nr:DUF58 domain-containing protein [Candidatus Competibacterales bacterium]
MRARALNRPDPADDGVHVRGADLARLRVEARRLRLAAQHDTGATAGARRTRLRGRGVDFQESRNYLPGDDISSIDWRVTARTGHPHTKVYTEERERPLTLVLDAGPSLFFATRGAFKSVVVARLAALLGWLAVLRQDRVGALLFAGERRRWLPPRAGGGAMRRLIPLLVDWLDLAAAPASRRPLGGLAPALAQIQERQHSGGRVVVVSDFQPPDSGPSAELTVEPGLIRLHRANQLWLCRILDPLECHPPPPGCYPVTDGREQRLLDLHGDACRRQWLALQARQRQPLEASVRCHGLNALTLMTDDELPALLQRSGGLWRP